MFTRPKSARRPATARLGLEDLEAREVPAVAVAGGAPGTPVVITGTNGNDDVTVTTGPQGQTIVTDNSTGRIAYVGFPSQVTFNGRGGHDKLDGSGCGVPIRADGGSGNDTLIGGSGNDTLIGGTGADSLSGNGGDDTIYTGTVGPGGVGVADGSADTVNGGGQSDTIHLDPPGPAGPVDTNAADPLDTIRLNRLAVAPPGGPALPPVIIQPPVLSTGFTLSSVALG